MAPWARAAEEGPKGGLVRLVDLKQLELAQEAVGVDPQRISHRV